VTCRGRRVPRDRSAVWWVTITGWHSALDKINSDDELEALSDAESVCEEFLSLL